MNEFEPRGNTSPNTEFRQISSSLIPDHLKDVDGIIQPEARPDLFVVDDDSPPSAQAPVSLKTTVFDRPPDPHGVDTWGRKVIIAGNQ